jgi:nitroreductase
VLDAARWAPSSGNVQNWRFIVIEDEKNKKIIAKASLGQNWLLTAPIIVLVCSNSAPEKAYSGRGKELYSKQNTAVAVQNILLAAHDQGLAGCWVGAFTETGLRKELKIPDDVDIHAIVPLGYPAESPRAPSRIELADVLYFEEWENTKRGEEPFPLKEQIPKIKEKAQKLVKKGIEKINKLRKK